LQPRCTCPDWADPCKHAAAVCYQVAEQMDRDPFTIFLLRGRGREELLAAVRARRVGTPEKRAGRRGAAGVMDRFIPAREALRPRASRPPLPRPLPPPERPGRPAPLAVPYDEELAEELAELAEDAARRAFELSWGLSTGGLDLSREEDLARRAAALLDTPGLDRLARRAGVRPRLLLSRAMAWRAGGRGAFRVLEGVTAEPTPEELEEAVAALAAVAGPVGVREGRVTSRVGGLQLRLGGDRLWYLLVRAGTGWEIREPPAADPAALLRGAAPGGGAGRVQPVSGRAREA
ncbi:MAG: SWIM zinc finger family protein, partial [Candidatus Dormibacteria bacterium]